MNNRINRGASFPSVPPFNAVYTAYEAFFLRNIEQRLGNDSRLEYIPVPEIELQLLNFTQSNSSSIGFLVGPIGIGKSSILRHVENCMDGKNASEVLRIDLNRNDAPFVVPDDLLASDSATQREYLKNAVLAFISGQICRHIKRHGREVDTTEDFHRFLQDHNPELLQHEGLWPPSSKEEKKNSLMRLSNERPGSFWYAYLKFHAHHHSLQQLVVILDNCDQRDSFLIEEFVSSLAHLDRCFENISREKITPPPSLVCIVACRPPVFQSLVDGSQRNVLGTHGYHEIRICKPVSIAAILYARYKAQDFEKQSTAVEYVSKNGMHWNIDVQKGFLFKLCERLEAHHHSSKLLMLTNHNVADALHAVLEVVRNKHFIDLDKVLVDLTSEAKDKDAEGGLPWTQILNSLAYGNQAGDPVYPGLKSRIPNILSSKNQPFPESIAKLQMTAMLVHRSNQDDVVPFQVIEVERIFRELFNYPDEATLTILDEMWEQGLVESRRGVPPNASKTNSIQATPRAIFLWEHLSKTTQLLSYYRDDVFLDERYLFPNTATWKLGSIEQRAEELVRLAKHVFEVELAFLSKITSTPTRKAYRRHFGTSFVSHQILQGLKADVLGYWKSRLDPHPAHELQKNLASFNAELKAASQHWFQGAT